LDRDRVGLALAVPEVDGGLAVATEAAVEGAVGVEAGDGELALVAEKEIAGVVAPACDDDLAVGLNGDAVGEVAAAATEVRAGDAVVAEGLVELAVGVEPRDREVVRQLTDGDDFAVVLDGYRGDGESNFLSDDFATAAEGRVQVAGAEQPPVFQRLEQRRLAVAGTRVTNVPRPDRLCARACHGGVYARDGQRLRERRVVPIPRYLL
jgi:hypothetical protein